MILNKIKINDTATVTPGVVYDISKATGQSYETLSDALSRDNVPLEIREGGMSIRFVLTSDNKYLQYRLMSDTFNTTVANWQGVDDEPAAGSDNLVKSGGVADKISELEDRISLEENNNYIKVDIDKDGKIYSSVTADGKKNEYLPTDFVGGAKIKGKEIANKEDISVSVNILREDINQKIDIIDGIYTEVTIDSNGKILESRSKDGFKYFHTDIAINGTKICKVDSNNIIEARCDNQGKIYTYVTKDGWVHIPLLDDGKTNNKKGFINAFAEHLSSGDVLATSNAPDVKINCDISFHAGIVSFGKIKLSHGELSYTHGIVEIDGSNVYEYNSSGTLVKTTPHGLIWKDYVDINIHVLGKPNSAMLNIDTNGGNYEADISWCGARDEVKAYAINGEYNNCQLTFGGSAFLKDVWVFGDSYTDMWTPYMDELGCKNYLCDGWGGRKSYEAYQSLIKCLMIGTPKIIVWLLGMNDPDSSTSIHTEYKDTLDKLISLCKKNDIGLAIGTIPNTPTMLHKHKNTYIRSLDDMQVIDVAKAFGADYVGSQWYDGLLSDDNIHPTAKGLALYAKFLSNEISYIK